MFYVRSNAQICLHFLSFLNICKKPTLISTKHKSFLTCSLDRTKHLVTSDLHWLTPPDNFAQLLRVIKLQ